MAGSFKSSGKAFSFLCLLLGLTEGCSTLPDERHPRSQSSPSKTAQTNPGAAAIQTVSHQEIQEPLLPAPDSSMPLNSGPNAHPFAGMPELPIEGLIQEVLGRNPSLAQMVAAWNVALARYPQVTSLEDPMLGSKLGPGSFGSNTVGFAYMLEVSQKIPFPGKLGLRGENALSEASAAGHDVEDMRLQLTENVKAAFYDYYRVERSLEVNADSLKLWEQTKKDATSRYENGKVEQQDVLQADVEIGRERERRLTLEEIRKVVIARINTLMHLPPDADLPPPPKEMAHADTLPGVQALRTAALARRPDLQALAKRIRAEEANLGLAQKQRYPDFEVAAGYDSFWQEQPLRPQVALRMNMPLYAARRFGAVSEAQAKIDQKHAELARQTDQVNFQVQESFEKVLKGEKSLVLYKNTILPAAELNAKAARSSYVTGKISALSRIEAERNLVNLRDRYFEAVADYHARKATLERVIGGSRAFQECVDGDHAATP